jgi:hypothetical protein
MRLVAIISAVLLSSAPVRATVIDVAPGAEVCRFPAASADDPLRRWFTRGELTCTQPSAMTFPEGRWNVFARTKTSVSVEPVLVDTKHVLPSSLPLTTVAGAALAVQLPPDASSIVYFPKHAAAVPVESRTVVPAGEELWLIVLVKGAPAGIFVIPPVPDGAERSVDARVMPAEHALLAWVRVADEDKPVLAKREVDTPIIRASDDEHSWDAATLPHARDLNGAFVLFPKVGTRPAQVNLTGRGWLAARATVTPGAAAVTVLSQPLAARLSANLTVNWSTAADVVALDQSVGECTATSDHRFELTVSSCAPREPGHPEPECRAFRTETLSTQVTYGSVNVGEVAPGMYRASLRYGKLPPVMRDLALAPLERLPLSVNAQYLQPYGSLTRGGHALDDDARIGFPADGVGFAPRGRDYTAVVPGGFGVDAKIEIATCRGEKTTVLADAPYTPKSRYDIDIPDNRLNITVVDTFTHIPIPSADVRYVVISKSFPPRPVITLNLKAHSGATADGGGDSDASGLSLRSVPPDRTIKLRVSSRGYKNQDIDPFSMTKSETKDLEVQLVPVNGTEGKIISARPFERATVHWYSPDGRETEHADLAADGTFNYDVAHYRTESLVVVSQSHPLWIIRAPIVDRRSELKLAFPDHAPVRNIRVVFGGVSPRLATFVGLTIGGVRVSAAAFSEHLALRGLPPFIVGAGPMAIPAVAETAPIDVLRGPSVPVMTTNNPAILREFIPLLVRRLQPGIDDVELEGR